MTKQDYKNKVLERFGEKFKGYKTTKFDLKTGDVEQVQATDTPMVIANREELKSFLSQSIDEAIELAFRECEQNKIEDVDEAWNLLCKLDANHKGLEEGSMILVNHCIDKRSKLENVFLGK